MSKKVTYLVRLKRMANIQLLNIGRKKIQNTPANAAKNPYVKKDESIKWEKLDNVEDMYTVIGKDFKFNINFSIFESINDTIETNIQKIMETRNLEHDDILERSIFCWFRNQYYIKMVNKM